LSFQFLNFKIATFCKFRLNLKLKRKIINSLSDKYINRHETWLKTQKEKEKVQKTVKARTALIVTLLASIIVGSAVAAIMVTRNVDLFMRIKRSISLALFDTDGTTELTSINLGDWLWDETKYFPGGGITHVGAYFINNTDQTDLYISFTVEGLPEGTLMAMFVKRGDKTSFTSLGTSPSSIYEYPLVSKLNAPDNPKLWSCQMYLYISVGHPTFGDYSPILHIHGHDSR